MVRVDEELRHQRELMQQGFALMEKRMEQVDKALREDNVTETNSGASFGRGGGWP